MTKAEEQKVETIIERLILADIGKLQGADAKKAIAEFNKLGAEASFHLIEGLNRTANLESSCPAVLIAKKLAGILTTTNDMQLLTFAKENIGAGVTAKRHLNVLHDLQTYILLRKGVLQRRALANKGAAGQPKSLSNMTLAELEKAAMQKGPRLRSILAEAEKRQGTKAVEVLLMGIANQDAQVVKLSEGLLAKNLNRQSAAVLKALLKHEQGRLRIAAADTIVAKRLRFGKELIELLHDGDVEVRQRVAALWWRNSGMDHGPDADASLEEARSGHRPLAGLVGEAEVSTSHNPNPSRVVIPCSGRVVEW